ncbi:hypothetical protein TL16_g07519 [Triparma laevis f. inornata]|uniref:Dynein light chain n=2 Tax=Triparma laevis TaxID=1534972 RepID=A0A9W7FCU1_9STRA|nr:hypothetical protein TL16_g07519 [Triparma laevis f. inornata]GMI09825.1 hypothetical protein TrLO_g416 [Triparma laevis f. longispina]
MMWGAKVKTPVDMPDDMLKDAVQTTIGALQECENFDKDGNEVVAQLKKYMDQKWTPNWHVVIGKNFGSFVTHETRCFLYFYYQTNQDSKAVMMYKAG